MVKRAVVSSARRTIAARPGTSDDVVPLDDRPLSLTMSADGKRVLVALPYEIAIFHAETLELEKSIELASAEPSVSLADDEGGLWIGGQHLHRGSIWSAKAEKFGSKLGGFVDRVVLLRPRLLCGVGTQGELLLDLEKEEVLHRRKVPERDVFGLVAGADGRALAIWAEGDGQPHAPATVDPSYGPQHHGWVLDPDHLSGYMKLKLKQTSASAVPAEAIVAIGRTPAGHCVLAARDGAIAWTNRALRVIAERVPAVDLRVATPLAIAADERWIYVLRPGATVHRFLIEQPPPEPGAPPKSEPPALPEAQVAKLPRHASALAVAPGGALMLAGPQADDQLGRLWRCSVDALAWSELPLRTRTLVEAPPEPATSGPKSREPSFVPTRTKLAGPPLAQLRVDDVLEGPAFWLTRTTGALDQRPTDRRTEAEVLPGDAVLLPAMVRLREGTARPALLLWPGVADELREPQPFEWITWGDRPRQWIPLRTLEIRAQGWTRREVFPLQVALRAPPPQVAGRRVPVPGRWVDPESFAALVKECKHLLKVLW
ncbi:MAG: hypothetical protein K1X88_31895 [Nannocystaceae bacterium]|nr:hypothetical protein [Nannocystaceae bacterium]